MALHRHISLLCATAVAVCGVAGAAYECASGETIGEIQGETGNVCAPRCSAQFECPTDVPAGASAQPQCMLKDVSDNSYCGLFCTSDMQCPSGAACKRVGTPVVSMCVHPLTFTEWAKTTRVKLAVGFPSGAPQNHGGFRIAQAFAAVQSLKTRFGIADGDPDVLVVKELLSMASSHVHIKTGDTHPEKALIANLMKAEQDLLKNLQSTQAREAREDSGIASDFGLGAWTADARFVAHNLADGPAGWERELDQSIWNLEHITDRHMASMWIRDLTMIFALYLGLGALFKYNIEGARGVDTIPHLALWLEYPRLVNDGVKYAKILLSDEAEFRPTGGFGGGRGERDTFTQFEPSRGPSS